MPDQPHLGVVLKGVSVLLNTRKPHHLTVKLYPAFDAVVVESDELFVIGSVVFKFLKRQVSLISLKRTRVYPDFHIREKMLTNQIVFSGRKSTLAQAPVVEHDMLDTASLQESAVTWNLYTTKDNH